MMHSRQIRPFDLDHVVAMALEQRSHFAGGFLPRTVGPPIFASLRCKIGSTAPSRTGFRNEMPFQDLRAAGLGFVTHNGDCQQVGIVKHRSKCVHQHIAQLAPSWIDPGVVTETWLGIPLE